MNNALAMNQFAFFSYFYPRHQSVCVFCDAVLLSFSSAARLVHFQAVVASSNCRGNELSVSVPNSFCCFWVTYAAGGSRVCTSAVHLVPSPPFYVNQRLLP